MIHQSIFKAYDIRGIYPTEIDEGAIELIARAYAKKFQPKQVVVGADVRTSSPSLKQSLIAGFVASGVSVIDIGTVSTDMMYFATAHLKTDGGLIISASHNPREYNGIKMVLTDALPISSDSGLFDLRDMIVSKTMFENAPVQGGVNVVDIIPAYLEHVKTFIDFKKLIKKKIVANGNFGMAGTIVQHLLKDTPIELVMLNENPDGTFPKGRPDPLRNENREETIALIRSSGADLGVVWDADADRCFFYDEQGGFVEGYFTTALLAPILLRGNVGAKVIYDSRLIWANKKAIEDGGGVPIENKAGHTFIKERMRKENALFAGEVSGHYYFRDNFYADNGMIPFLILLEELCRSEKVLSQLVAPLRNTYFTSGEVNFEVPNPKQTVSKIKEYIQEKGEGSMTEIDGFSVAFPRWRFNIRSSNTEPLLRLNLETLDADTLQEKITEIKKLIEIYA